MPQAFWGLWLAETLRGLTLYDVSNLFDAAADELLAPENSFDRTRKVRGIGF